MLSRTTRPSNSIDLDRAFDGLLDRRDAPVRVVALAHDVHLVDRRQASGAPTATDGSATAINESDTGGPARSCSTFFGSVFPNCRPIAATCSDPTTATATPPGPSVLRASWHLCARISDRSAPIVSRAARNAAAAAVADGAPSSSAASALVITSMAPLLLSRLSASTGARTTDKASASSSSEVPPEKNAYSLQARQ